MAVVPPNTTSREGTVQAQRVDQSVKLPAPVRRRLRLSAAYLDREISELVELAVIEYLDGLDRARKEQGLAPLPRPED